jgi:hypothetical protein
VVRASACPPRCPVLLFVFHHDTALLSLASVCDKLQSPSSSCRAMHHAMSCHVVCHVTSHVVAIICYAHLPHPCRHLPGGQSDDQTHRWQPVLCNQGKQSMMKLDNVPHIYAPMLLETLTMNDLQQKQHMLPDRLRGLQHCIQNIHPATSSR